MREILFRGQMEGGEWYFGFFIKRQGIANIFKNGMLYEVDPETVGQLRYENKHGRYFDGDIYYHAGLGLETVSDLCEIQDALLHGNEEDICEIIGNIHENAELLK